MEYNERIIKDFGQQVVYGDWSKGMFETKDGAYFMALGIDQPFRGLRRYTNRIDFACVDDIEDREVANNPRRVRQRSEKILSDFGGAFTKATKRLVICNNFITNTGVIAYLLKKIGNSPYTDIACVNIINKEGTPSWKERYSPTDVQIQRDNTDYYTWMREFMNTPVEEGKIFQEKWIQYTKCPPLAHMEALVVYGDLSYKETGDYKALVFVGKKGRDFFLIETYVRQSTRDKCAKWLYDLYETLHLERFPVNYWIEGLFAQDEFTNDFDNEGDIRGSHIPVVADKKNKQGKYERIESMVGFWERGNIHLNELRKENNDFKTFVTQLLAFEKGRTAHDDALDAFQSAIAMLNKATIADNWEQIRIGRWDQYNKHSKHRF